MTDKNRLICIRHNLEPFKMKTIDEIEFRFQDFPESMKKVIRSTNFHDKPWEYLVVTTYENEILYAFVKSQAEVQRFFDIHGGFPNKHHRMWTIHDIFIHHSIY